MAQHYCHNCRESAILPDGTHCQWCLTYFYANSRMPLPGDTLPPASALNQVYSQLGWSVPEAEIARYAPTPGSGWHTRKGLNWK